jgi:arylsulfatase A-like enzyme
MQRSKHFKRSVRLRFAGLLLASIIAVACGAAPTGAEQKPAPPGAPNVLIFVTDDQRADSTLALMAATRKWFTRRGRTFTHAYATTPLCCPARTSILTGQYAHNHGVRKNNQGHKLPQKRTLQRTLWLSGYNTALVGKFLNGWPLERDPPFFDRWAFERWGYYDTQFNVNGTIEDVAKYSTTYTGDRALEFIDEFETEDPVPWFMYVAPFAAHKPFIPQERYAKANVGKWHGNPAVRENNLNDKPEFIKDRELTPQEGHQLRRKQLRTLLSADDVVGRVMQRLKQNGELNDTLAFFISDNGFSWGEHHLNGKRLPYQESVRVALMMRWPGHVARNSEDRRLVTNLDLAATIYGATKIDPPHRLDGMSLLKNEVRDRLLFESYGNFQNGLPSWASTLTGNYQYVEYYGRRGRRIFREFYRMDRDPWQLKNLLGNRKHKDDPWGPPLKAQLAQDRGCIGDTCP